jgi:ribosomal protein L11 methyltransferase
VRHLPETPGEHRLFAWLPEIDWPPSQREELERALEPLARPFDLELPPLHWHRQPDEDWSLTWKRHWFPDPVGRSLLILPAWMDPPPDLPERHVVRIDPGSAFGTGSHPTTRLCLEAMEGMDLQGCGWRTWGAAAASSASPPCGWERQSVAACDTDSLAVRATVENGRLNGLEGSIQVALGSVEALAPILDGRRARLLLCNILAPVIEALCPHFHTVLAPEGVGLLSGLLVEQARGLETVLAAAGWRAELTSAGGFLGVDGDPAGPGCFIRHADLCSGFDWPSRVPAESSP